MFNFIGTDTNTELMIVYSLVGLIIVLIIIVLLIDHFGKKKEKDRLDSKRVIKNLKKIQKEQMWERIGTKLEKGSIILMHNGTENTANSLDMLLTNIENKGYKDGKGGRGKLILETKIMIPKNPSEKEMKLFKEFNELSNFNPRNIEI